MKPDFDEHYRQLEALYVEASPARRGEIAQDRMRYPKASSNRLITVVSATEALARALVLQQLEEKSLFQKAIGQRKVAKTKLALYRKVQHMTARQLLAMIAAWGNVGPEKAFGRQTWPTFLWAVKFRNLLIHEAAFIGDLHASALIKASEDIFLYLQHTYAGGWGEPTHRMKRLP